MTVHRFLVPSWPEGVRTVTLPPKESHHAAVVLRLKKGATLVVFDGVGHERHATIHSIKNGLVECRFDSAIQHPPTAIINSTHETFHVTLAQAVLKREAMDWLIEKAVELGVSRIVPMITDRTIIRPAENPDRWARRAMEASKQCERSRIPEVAALRPFQEVLRMGDGVGVKLLCLERSQVTVKACLKKSKETVNRAMVLVGPEGGLTPQEIQQATASGFEPVSLGSAILRAETAGVAVISMLAYEYS